MERDLIVIGSGAAGEAAGSLAKELNAKITVIERDLVGGVCSFWACMPSKTLLDAAERRHVGAPYSWERASRRRDWMISREDSSYPSDESHVQRLEAAGAELIRGAARIVGPGRVEVQSDRQKPRTLEASNILVAIGSEPIVPEIDGLDDVAFWRSAMATSTRELPSSILVVGGGAVGVEMAQIFVRFGSKTALVHRDERLLAQDHPKTSEALTDQLREEGVNVRLGVTVESVKAGGAGHIAGLSDGSTEEAAEMMIAVGRRPLDFRELGAHEAGVTLTDEGHAEPDERMNIAPGVFVAGDAAGGPQFTHVADYEGRVATRAALGEPIRVDLDTVPRTIFTDPETAAVGLQLQEAQERGIDAFEVSEDFATTARGYTIEGSRGHVTAVIDRERGVLVGAFAAAPGASELIHEAVLAVKLSAPVKVLADTIHSFPTGARVFGNLMLEAQKQLR